MKDLGALMKQAQEMQARVSDIQKRMADIEIDGSAGAGLVRVTLSGKGEARKVAIDRSLIKPEEADVLEDLVAAAINDARSRLDARMAEEMRAVTGGLSLPPGFKTPF